MSQHDYVIDNGPGLAVRTDINAAIQALASVNSGPTEPTTMYPGMLWLDTSVGTNGTLKQRNLANTGWITPPAAFLPLAGGTLTGNLSVTTGSPVMNLTNTTSGVLSRINPASSVGHFYIDADVGNIAPTALLAFRNGGNVIMSLSKTETVVESGDFHLSSGAIMAGATSSAAGSVGVGTIINSSGGIYSKRSGTASITHFYVYNNASVTPTQVGSISSSGSATAFNTSSDETLKTFTGELSGDDAIAIIRADPVRRFTWNIDGTAAVGWGAQTSYAVSPDLASPPPPYVPDPDDPNAPQTAPGPGEPGYQPWSIDQGRRTPYLWAALTKALDRIDALEARIAALEAA